MTNPYTPNFKEAKVGDECFSVSCGVMEITSTESSMLYPIQTEENQYDMSGRCWSADKHPTLFNSFQQFMSYWGWEKENGGSNDSHDS